MKRLLIAAALAASFGSAQADAVQDYRIGTQSRYEECEFKRLIVLMDLATGKTPSDIYERCLVDGNKDARDQYAAAAKQVSKKPAAIAALKDHLVRVLAASRGLDVAVGGERKFLYEARQSALNAAVEEAWIRFEVEL